MILQILNSLAANGSSKKKEAILAANKDNMTLKRIFRMINDKQLNFGIRKFPMVETGPIGGDIELMLDFMENILGERVLTGNAAIEAFANELMKLSADDVQVIKRVLAKDMDCGVGRSIPGKIWKDIIQDQPQFLAESYSEKAVAKVPMPAYAQLKADGARCIAEVRDGVVMLLSRAGNRYLCLPEVEEAVRSITAHLDYDVVVDGELIFYPALVKKKPTGLDAFMDADEVSDLVASRTEGNGLATKSLKGTISPEEASGMVLQAWDIIPLDVTYDKTKKLKSNPYKDRYELLYTSIQQARNHNIQLIPTEIVNTLDEAKLVYFKYLYEGYEGIILKNMQGLWANARTGDQVKFKNEIVLDCRIVDTYVHRKDPNKLGGVIVETQDGLIRARVGSGFKDTTSRKDPKTKQTISIPLSERHEYDRERLWSIREILIDQIAQIKCNCPIRSDGNTEQGSLFLPIFQLLREDKDKANTFEEAFGFTWQDFLDGQVIAMPEHP